VAHPYNVSERNHNPFRDLHQRPERGRKQGSVLGSMVRFVLLVVLGCAAGGVGIVAQSYLFFVHNLPSVEKLKNYAPPIVTQMYGDGGELIAEFAAETRFLVSIDQVPKIVQDAFVSAEDKNFWHHPGVDREAILRAIIQNIKTGGRGPGGSTITQQVARTFLLTPEKKFIRKIKEQILAIRIEESLSKKQILHLYLNQIYLGSSAYGVEAAARTYFGKHIHEVSIAEAAMLAGLPQRPADYSPKKNLDKAMMRRTYVLRRMLEDGYIAQAQHDQAVDEEPNIVTRSDPYLGIAPHFAEHVRRYIVQKYGADALSREGLQVYTTVDLRLTQLAQRAMDSGLRELDRRQGYRGPIKTLNAKGVLEFLEQKSKELTEPLRFGDMTTGVITAIDDENIYVRMGTFKNENTKKDYVGRIRIDKNPKWWVRRPYVRPQMRTRNFAEGDLPFQVGDVILVRLLDLNELRRDLHLKKYGAIDPNTKNFSEATLPYFPLEPEQDPVVESALLFRENRTGYVRVMLGGRVFSEAKLNRVVQARRQAGSSFKPAIYAAALNRGFTCADVIIDSPAAFMVPGTGEAWRPKNFGGGFLGPVSFREAIVKSRNIPTVKILQQIGIEHAKAYARKLGYTSPMPNNLTMALGSTNVSLEEQVGAFSVFPNRGYLVPSVYVKKIVDRNGRVLEENPPPVLLDDPLKVDQPQVQKVSHDAPGAFGSSDSPELGAAFLRRRIDEGTAYIMCSLLQGVVQSGTATNLKKIVGRTDIAGKTGTTNDAIDAWFVGFSPDYSCGVWVGFDEEQPLGTDETGGKAAAPIWGYFMREVLRDKPVKEFQSPQSIVFRRVDARTGLGTAAREGILEVFKEGSGPSDQEPTLVKGARWDYSGSDLDQF